MTDYNYRDLCAELVEAWDTTSDFDYNDFGNLAKPLVARARTALAEPADAPAAVADGPSDEELRDLWSWAAGQDQGPWPTQQHAFARAVLARWGQPPAPPAEGEVAELVRWLRDKGRGAWPPPDGLSPSAQAEEYEFYSGLTRAAELLERHAEPPAPPAEGEIAGLVNMLTGIAYWKRHGKPGERDPSPFDIRQADRLTRAAELLERHALVPVPVSERLPGPEDCDDKGRCWWWRTDNGDEWWELLHINMDVREYNALCGDARYTHWLPANALPLPALENEK